MRRFVAPAPLSPVNPGSYFRNHRSQIRKLINALPVEHRQRELVSLARFRRAHRWDNFSPRTPEILADFAKNGRKLKRGSTRQSPVLTNVLLSEPHRKQIAAEARTFMRVVQAKDILEVTVDDVEEFIDYYDGKGKRQVAINILDYIRPVFTNLRAKGLISTDPLKDVPGKQTGQNLDYIDQAGMDTLADLSTLDMNCFKDVRDRLLTFSIYYDFALRNREGSLVKTSDFRLNDTTSLVVRKDIQKIQREDSLIFSYFPLVTRPLLERYLHLRARVNPATDILMVSSDGVALEADGCRQAVRQHCDRLGVKTYDGKTPTPHRLRHSFGSLNISPLGRCLEIVEVKEHYRHSSIDTTYELYVAKNTILKTERYQARMKVIGKGDVTTPRTNGSGFSPNPATTLPIAAPPLTQDEFISENEAIKRVRQLGLNYRALRQYGLASGKAQRNGRGYDYSAALISDLASNYFTRREAMDLLNMARATFFDWTKAEGVEFIQIGQVGLFRKDLILQERRSA